MERETRNALEEWLNVLVPSKTSISTIGISDPLVRKPITFTFHDVRYVTHSLYSDTYPGFHLKIDSPDTVLFEFLFHRFSKILVSSDLKPRIRKVVQSAGETDSNEALKALTCLWGWIVLLWFGDVSVNYLDPYAGLDLKFGNRLQEIMKASLMELCDSSSDLNREHLNPPESVDEVTTEVSHMSRCKIEDVAPLSYADSTPKISRSTKDLETRVMQLDKENTHFYLTLVESRKALASAYDRHLQLENELLQKDKKIVDLTTRMEKTQDAEADMASELYGLKRMLTAEKAVSSRLREKTAWFQVQLFNKGAFCDVSCKTTKQLAAGESTSLPAIYKEDKVCETIKDSTLQRLRAENTRYFLSLQTLQGRYNSLVEKDNRRKDEEDVLKKELLKVSTLQAERGYFESELIAQKAANATQFELIHTLNIRICALEKELVETKELKDTVFHESLGEEVHVTLKNKLKALMDERDSMKNELRTLQHANFVEAVTECDALKKQVHMLLETRKQTDMDLLMAKAEKDKYQQTVTLLQSEIKEQEAKLNDDVNQFKQKIALLQDRLQASENELQAAHKCHEAWSMTHKRDDEEWGLKNKQIEALQSENKMLQKEIDRLRETVKSRAQETTDACQEIEQNLKPQIHQLSLALSKAEAMTEVKTDELNVQQLLLKEKQDQITNLTSNLSKMQQRMKDLENKFKTYHSQLQTYEKRLRDTEAQLYEKTMDHETLQRQKDSLDKRVLESEQELHTLMKSHTKLRQSFAELESQHVMKLDECRHAESQLTFYRTEFERLSQSSFPPGGNVDTSREADCRQLLDEVWCQLSTGKQELEHLNRSLEDRVSALPRSIGGNKEFEIEDIIDHFEKEKIKSGNKVRTMTLRLTEAEEAYKKLYREHQTLTKAHATLLRNYIESDKQTNERINAINDSNDNNGVTCINKDEACNASYLNDVKKEANVDNEINNPTSPSDIPCRERTLLTNGLPDESTSSLTPTKDLLSLRHPDSETRIRGSYAGDISYNDRWSSLPRQHGSILETTTAVPESSVSPHCENHFSSSSSSSSCFSPVMHCVVSNQQPGNESLSTNLPQPDTLASPKYTSTLAIQSSCVPPKSAPLASRPRSTMAKWSRTHPSTGLRPKSFKKGETFSNFF